MPTAFLIASIIGLLFTINAFRPPRVEVLSIFSFFGGWLTSELPLHHLFWQLIATGAFIAAGALDGWQGWVGLLLTAISWIGLAILARRGMQAGAVVDRALRADLGVDPPAGLPTGRQWRRLALPFSFRDPDVEAVRDIAYAEDGSRAHRLDIYRPRRPVAGAPVLLYIHGGGWVLGDKREQGLPMMLHLAARGWVCATINYRLSPKVAFPEHLVDCKRALAWVKENIGSYGGDPGCITVSGGSAGGHLTALVALTAGRPELQPGFEDADLSVQAAVPFYGLYDFANHDGDLKWGFRRFIAKTVLQTTPEADPERYALASPIDQIRPDAPPFLIIHGANDTLAPVTGARTFARALRSVSESPVVYAELPGAQHAFEVFRSIRTAEVVPRVEVFLRAVLGLGDLSAPARDESGTPARLIPDPDAMDPEVLASDVMASDGRRLGHRAQATRRRLLEATADLLESRGALELTVVEIARKVGTSPASFYQYFQNVEEAVLALSQEVGEELGRLAGLVNQPWKGPQGFKLCRQLVAGFIQYWDENRAVLRVRDLAAQEGDRRFREGRIQSLSMITDPLTEKVVEAQEAGRVAPEMTPYATAGAMVAMMGRMAAYHRSLEPRGRFTQEDMIETVARIVYTTVTGRRP